MKYLLLTFLVILKITNSFCQTYNIDWSTYYGGQLTELRFVEYDTAKKCIYVVGITADTIGIATMGAHKESMSPVPIPLVPMLLQYWKTDVFLAKFDMSGNRLWATYIGGTGRDMPTGMTLDKWGNIYISGGTESLEGIGTPGTHKSTKTIGENMSKFIVKFSPEGDQVWGTYIGNDDFHYNNFPMSMKVDSLGQVYIGTSAFPDEGIVSTPGVFQETIGGLRDGLIMKFNENGTLMWSTYLGGIGGDDIMDIDISHNGFLYISGRTNSPSVLGTTGTYYSDIIHTSVNNSFITKFTLDGERIWGTYIPVLDPVPPSISVSVHSIITDVHDNVYVYGTSKSLESISTEGVYQEEYGHTYSEFKAEDMFIMKFDVYGQRIWGTYLGGDSSEYTNQGSVLNFGAHSKIELTPDHDEVIVTGGTKSLNGMPDSCGYMDYTHNKGFIVSIKSADGTLRWGNRFDDCIVGLKTIKDDNSPSGFQMIGVGVTSFDGMATPGSHQDNKDGLNSSGFIVKFIEEECGESGISLSLSGSIMTAEPGYNEYKWYHNGDLVHLSAENTWDSGEPSPGDYYVRAFGDCCVSLSDTIHIAPTHLEFIEHENFVLYPNPTQDNISIDFGRLLHFEKDWNVIIYNFIGRKIDSQNFKAGDYKEIFVPLHELSPGLYFILIEGQSKAYSFIKE